MLIEFSSLVDPYRLFPSLLQRPQRRHFAATGSLRVTLRTPGNGARSVPRRVRPAEVELGCLYQLPGRHVGVVQRFGSQYGAFDAPPFVRLTRDERSWAAAGANLFVNLERIRFPYRLLLFACAYRGSLAGASLKLDISPSAGQPFHINPGRAPSRARTCALATVTSHGAGELVIHREARFFAGSQLQVARAYGFHPRSSGDR